MKPISAAADTFLYDNVGKAEIYGGEFYVDFQLKKRLTFFMNSSYVVGNDIKLKEPLPKMPPLAGLFGLRFEAVNRNYWLELNSKFVRSQTRVVENEAETSGYVLVNFSSGLNFQKLLNFSNPVHVTLNINNILNKNYRDHLSYVTWWSAPGRNIVFGLRSNF